MSNLEIAYTDAKDNLASILDRVCEDREIAIVKQANGNNVALIPEDELTSLLESIYLLRSPENAQRLFRALKWAESEVGKPQTIEELKEELGIEF
ncbi:MAG: type II toxin-antitoxin system Phd/YefM family antitoxin [Cyanobacteria bacterium SBLK]|nr:type II toxin-antitoxin system Phd/YefM family antitoxin [Cyanobacteria bacterium SBLK]